MKRKIIKIDEKKCNGCGLCIPNCPEGALQIIDGKARLVSDLFCDGLGACIGCCSQDAITTEERETKPYDEKRVMENIVKAGKNTIIAHLKHLKDHNEIKYFNEALRVLKGKGIDINLEEISKIKDSQHGCPGAAPRGIKKEVEVSTIVEQTSISALRQWPVQLSLLPIHFSFFENSNLLVAADCIPFANANFHSKLLSGKSLVIGCPKLDDIKAYQEKLTEIFRNNDIKSITVAVMEVPCCNGLYAAVEKAVKATDKGIPIVKKVIRINGEEV